MITRFGPPEVLVIREMPDPKPRENQILVRVKAIGLNFADIFARLGVYPGIPDPPFIPGLEISGLVSEVGSGVRRWKRGSRVVAFTRQGAYAEKVCVDENHALGIPQQMSFSEGAAIGVSYLTAYHGLVTLANARNREKLLLHAAAGGVGTAAIQIAKHLGLEVFATAGSDKKVEITLKQGADHGVNYRTQDFVRMVRESTGNEGVDIVMDSVGGSVFRKSWKLLAPMGRYILYGFASAASDKNFNRLKALKEMAAMPVIYPPFIVSKNLGFFGFNLYFLMNKVEYMTKALKQILKWHQQKVIRPFIGAKFHFDEIADAQKFLQSRQSVGKIVVTV